VKPDAAKPTLKGTTTEVPVTVKKVRPGLGEKLSGSFNLQFKGQTTRSIPYTASAEKVKKFLEALSTVVTVDVQRSTATPNNEFAWLVTFISPDKGQPLLMASPANLQGTGANVTVQEIRQGSSPEVQIITAAAETSNFTCTYEGHESAYLSTHSTDFEFKTVLEALPSVSTVHIERFPQKDASASWRVTFLEMVGDVPEITCNKGVNVSTVFESTSTRLGGNFTLEFEGNTTSVLQHDASAAQVKSALETASKGLVVQVNKTAMTKLSTCAEWIIKFTNRQDNVPSIKVHDSNLFGTSMSPYSEL